MTPHHRLKVEPVGPAFRGTLPSPRKQGQPSTA